MRQAHLFLPTTTEGELSEGWNEPSPPKRGWSVYHHYGGDGRSRCGKYNFDGRPPKPHFQITDREAPWYRAVHTDWLCKRCLKTLVDAALDALAR